MQFNADHCRITDGLIRIDPHWFAIIYNDLHRSALIRIDQHWFQFGLIDIDLHWSSLISNDRHWSAFMHIKGWVTNFNFFCPSPVSSCFKIPCYKFHASRSGRCMPARVRQNAKVARFTLLYMVRILGACMTTTKIMRPVFAWLVTDWLPETASHTA